LFTGINELIKITWHTRTHFCCSKSLGIQGHTFVVINSLGIDIRSCSLRSMNWLKSLGIQGHTFVVVKVSGRELPLALQGCATSCQQVRAAPLLFLLPARSYDSFFLRTKLPTTGTTGTIAFDPTFGKFLPYYNWFQKIRWTGELVNWFLWWKCFRLVLKLEQMFFFLVSNNSVNWFLWWKCFRLVLNWNKWILFFLVVFRVSVFVTPLLLCF